MTVQSTLAQAGGSIKSRGETCRQRRRRQQIGIEKIGRRAVGIQSIQQCLTIRESFFLRLRTRFGCLKQNFQTTDGECEQNTHSNSMYSCAQCVTTHTERIDYISSREHAWLKIAHLCVSKKLSSTCHVSFLAAPDTYHKHKFSLTCLTYLSDVLSLTPKSFGARSIFALPRFTAEWRINTNPISLTKGGGGRATLF